MSARRGTPDARRLAQTDEAARLDRLSAAGVAATAASSSRPAGSRTRSRTLWSVHARHLLERGERQAFAGEEQQAEPNPDHDLDGLDSDAGREAVRVADPVRQKRKGNTRLVETNRARPEREGESDIDDEQDERGGRDRLVDAEPFQSEPDGQ